MTHDALYVVDALDDLQPPVPARLRDSRGSCCRVTGCSHASRPPDAQAAAARLRRILTVEYEASPRGPRPAGLVSKRQKYGTRAGRVPAPNGALALVRHELIDASETTVSRALASYDLDKLTLCSIGSHSALEVAGRRIGRRACATSSLPSAGASEPTPSTIAGAPIRRAAASTRRSSSITSATSCTPACRTVAPPQRHLRPEPVVRSVPPPEVLATRRSSAECTCRSSATAACCASRSATKRTISTT